MWLSSSGAGATLGHVLQTAQLAICRNWLLDMAILSDMKDFHRRWADMIGEVRNLKFCKFTHHACEPQAALMLQVKQKLLDCYSDSPQWQAEV